MPTKVETKQTGIQTDKEEKKDTYKELGSVIEKKKRTKDGDAEAGVDAQDEQLNTMPNDPTDRPKEKED